MKKICGVDTKIFISFELPNELIRVQNESFEPNVGCVPFDKVSLHAFDCVNKRYPAELL